MELGPHAFLPREKAERIGFSTLSDVELLALLLSTGTKRENVLELSTRLLASKGGLKAFFECPVEELRTAGIGKAKMFRIGAVAEIFRRLPFKRKNRISSPKEFYENYKHCFFGEGKERLYCALIGGDGQLLSSYFVQEGTKKSVSFRVESFLATVKNYHPYGVILCHNHPSGTAVPSKEDDRAFLQIKRICEKAGVVLLDSIIFCRSGYFSYLEKENKKIKKSY